MSNIFTRIIADIEGLAGVTPAVEASVKSVEAASQATIAAGNPAPSSADKAAQAVQQTLTIVQSVAPEVLNSIGLSRFTAGVEKIVADVVSWMNKIGAFIHSSTPPSAPPAP
jgi:hypothetical protein